MGPRLQLTRPSATALSSVAQRSSTDPTTYEDVGLTARPPIPSSPLGADGERRISESSPAAWARARRLFFGRTMFVRTGIALPADIEVTSGQVFAYGAQFGPAWTVNVCRVVYVEGQQHDDPVAAFAHGTLPMHGVRGEERFELRRDDNDIVFRIVQCSWPASAAVSLVTPAIRPFQRRFIRASLDAFEDGILRP